MNIHFFNIISKLLFIYDYVQLKSCVGPSLSALLFSHLVIPSFRMILNIFLLTLRIKLSLPHPTTCVFFNTHAIKP